ncbi:MAG TPA: hypothetical protein VHM65_05355, partial [Candidatus Lustribacter sp.]|nr:hypothetical protein [Candidatus Lustribacter sp.]
GYDIALVSTDPAATAAQIIERYAARWSIEVAIEDAKQTTGVGQARNRLATAVERTVPFELVITSLAICWYATTGYQPGDVRAARDLAPWYRDKTQPSVADMLTMTPPGDHRRTITASRPPAGHSQRNQHPSAGLGEHRRITAKVEGYGAPRASRGGRPRPRAPVVVKEHAPSARRWVP